MNTRFLTRPEGRIAFDDTGGEGPLVLAVPGLGDVRGEYRFLREPLVAAGFRVVTVDLRGHGDSDASFSHYSVEAVGEDVLALVEHLDAGPAVLIGTSFAAGAAAHAAAVGGDKVSGLIAIGPSMRHTEPGAFMRVAMKVLFGGPWQVSAWLWYFDTLFPAKKPRDHAAYKAALGENLKQPGRMGAAIAMMYASRREVEARLSDVAAPALVVMGTKDPDFPDPKAEAELLASRMGGEVLMIEGSGHYPHVELPDVTVPGIVRFLRKVAR